MITKEQLQAMSDFQRNVKLFELLGGSACSLKEGDNGDIVFENGCTLNYCNTPNDIIPLAFEHGISFLSSGSRLISTATNDYKLFCDGKLSDPEFEEAGGIYFIDVEPLRAIACCLILVLQEKKQ